MDEDNGLLEFFDILNDMDVDLDDLGIDPADLEELDVDDLNSLLDQIEPPEDDEIEIFMGDLDEDEEED